MEIKRDLYLNKLIVRKQNGFIKVITGVRRCGKSYLLNTLFYNHLLAEGVDEGHIVKFAFDSADDLRLIGEDLFEIDEENRKVDPVKFMDYVNTRVTDSGLYFLLLDILASEISTLVNPKKLSDTFKSVKNSGICATTVAKYISHLEDAFLISKVRRFDVKGKRYIDTPYKVYFEDIGLRNARLNFRQIEPTHLMENIIFNELRYRGYNVDVGVVESRERDKDGKEIRKQLEIDFIANQGSRRYYIQSAYEIPSDSKWEQETRSFDKTNDSFKKIIIVERSMKPRRDDKGYVTMGVKEFLLNENSLEL